MATRDQIEAAIAFIGAAFPNFQLPEQSLEVYSRYLEDIDAEDLLVACERIVKSARYFPAIAEIRTEASIAKGWREHEQEREEQQKRIADRSEWKGLQGERLTEIVKPLKKWLVR